MRYANGTLSDLTIALNQAITELSAPVSLADGSLASATSQLNLLLVWRGSSLAPANGTLSGDTSTYNAFVSEQVVYVRIKCAKVQPNDNNNRVTLTWIGPDAVQREYTVNQRSLNRFATAEEAKAALDTFTMGNFGYILNDVWLHKNSDGLTWAIATGAVPLIWPEDEPEWP